MGRYQEPDVLEWKEEIEWKGGDPGYIPYIVTDYKVYQGMSGDSHMTLMFSVDVPPGALARTSPLRIYYNPDENEMQITSHRPDEIPWEKLDMFVEYTDAPLTTRVKFLGILGSTSLRALYFSKDGPIVHAPVQSSVEGYYPSGTPIRGGDRRPVKVRGHLRGRIVKHLESPPSACLCHRSKWVDRRRKGLIRRLKR